MESTKKSQVLIGWIVAAMFLFFGGVSTMHRVSDCLIGNASLNWPSTNGTVISSSLEYYEDELYTAFVRYRYEVNAKSYECDLVSPGNPVMSEYEAQQLLAKYSTGASVSVFYNPQSPSKAILEPGVGWGLGIVTFLSLLVMAFGGGLMYVFWSQSHAQ